MASAINEKTSDFESLLESAYEFDRGVYDIKACMDNEENYRAEAEFAWKHGLSYIAFRPRPSRELTDAGIIEIYFPEEKIVLNQSEDYICHRGVRETWGYTGNHLDVGRFKQFSIPESWIIIDKYFFGKLVRIEGEIDEELEHRLWERVDLYRKRGCRVIVL